MIAHDGIINDDLPPMRAIGVSAPVQLQWIIERCLAKEPSERYASTTDLHRELRMLRDRLTEISGREGTSPWIPAHPWRFALLVVVAAALVASVFWLVPFAGGDVVDLSDLRFAPLAAETAYEGFAAWSPAGEVIVYAADVDGVLQIFTRRLSSSRPVQVTYGNFDATSPFWSHDGNRIYYVSQAQDRQGIWSIGASGGTPQIVVRDAIRGAISPDGATSHFSVTRASPTWSAPPDSGFRRQARRSRGPATTWKGTRQSRRRSARFGSSKVHCRFRPMARDSGSARWPDRLHSNRSHVAGNSGACR